MSLLTLKSSKCHRVASWINFYVDNTVWEGVRCIATSNVNNTSKSGTHFQCEVSKTNRLLALPAEPRSAEQRTFGWPWLYCGHKMSALLANIDVKTSGLLYWQRSPVRKRSVMRTITHSRQTMSWRRRRGCSITFRSSLFFLNTQSFFCFFFTP